MRDGRNGKHGTIDPRGAVGRRGAPRSPRATGSKEGTVKTVEQMKSGKQNGPIDLKLGVLLDSYKVFMYN